MFGHGVFSYTTIFRVESSIPQLIGSQWEDIEGAEKKKRIYEGKEIECSYATLSDIIVSKEYNSPRYRFFRFVLENKHGAFFKWGLVDAEGKIAEEALVVSIPEDISFDIPFGDYNPRYGRGDDNSVTYVMDYQGYKQCFAETELDEKQECKNGRIVVKEISDSPLFCWKCPLGYVIGGVGVLAAGYIYFMIKHPGYFVAGQAIGAGGNVLSKLID